MVREKLVRVNELNYNFYIVVRLIVYNGLLLKQNRLVICAQLRQMFDQFIVIIKNENTERLLNPVSVNLASLRQAAVNLQQQTPSVRMVIIQDPNYGDQGVKGIPSHSGCFSKYVQRKKDN